MASDRQTKTTTNDRKAQNDSAQELSRVADTLPADLVKSSTWDEDTLRNVQTFDDAIALVEAQYGKLVSADEVMGDGFTLLDSADKGRLVGLPLIAMEWTFNDGDFGRFVSVRLMVKEKSGSTSRYILNDGSTGICEQLAEFTKRTGRSGGLVVKKGLRVSEYTYQDNDGTERPAKTYYIDTSAA